MFTLEWAAEVLGAQVVGTVAGVTVRSVCTDTRQGAEGALFFALPGENADGHRYVAQAFEKGAVGAVVSREVEGAPGPLLIVPDTLVAFGDLAMHYRRQFDIPVVGVTGSVGKTSTKEMIAAVLRTKYRTLASAKNYNNEIGVPQTLFQLTREHEAAVIEMGMRGPGQIDRLAEIAQPTVGVITNIGYAHIEILGSRSKIAKAKAELLIRLPIDGIAVLPRCRYYACLRKRVPESCRLVTFSSYSCATRLHADNAVRVISSRVRFDRDGSPCFHVKIGPSEYDVTLRVIGEHHVDNAKAALAVAFAMGIPIPQAVAALESWEGAAGRMVVRRTSDDITVLDDCYNAGPESMASALETLERTTHSGRVAVLGDMKELGDYTVKAHLHVGRLAKDTGLRLLVTVGDAVQEIAVGAERYARFEGPLPPAHQHFADSAEAAARIRQLVQPGDTVLVKGSRAMEMEKIVAALMGEALTPPAPLSHAVGEGGDEEGRDA